MRSRPSPCPIFVITEVNRELNRAVSRAANPLTRRAMRLLRLAAALLLPPVYGVADCGACHPRETTEWSKSAHAQSLKPVIGSRFYRALPDRPIGEAPGGFLLLFKAAGDALEVTASRGSQSAAARIDWVFGAGRRAQTPIAAL